MLDEFEKLSFAGKSFDWVVSVAFRVSQRFKYMGVDSLKIVLSLPDLVLLFLWFAEHKVTLCLANINENDHARCVLPALKIFVRVLFFVIKCPYELKFKVQQN